MATHLLVGNSTAQSGKNKARIDKACAWFREHDVACDFLATEANGKTIPAVTTAIEQNDYRSVVYMGGDGTFREVASAILASSKTSAIAMGMLPTGTANDQGRSFGLDAGDAALEKNLDVILAGRETLLDAGKLALVDDPAAPSYFFDSAGWGISARILRERNQDRERVQNIPILKEIYRDQLVYAGAVLKVFLESYVVSDKFSARVVADGVTYDFEGLTDLIVKGTRIYGGAWVLDPNSKHDDGKFEVIPFCGKRDWTSKAIVDFEGIPLSEEALNAIGIEHSKPFSASKLEIVIGTSAGASKLCAQLDGEEFTAAAHVLIDVIPRALRLIIP